MKGGSRREAGRRRGAWSRGVGGGSRGVAGGSLEEVKENSNSPKKNTTTFL